MRGELPAKEGRHDKTLNPKPLRRVETPANRISERIASKAVS